MDLLPPSAPVYVSRVCMVALLPKVHRPFLSTCYGNCGCLFLQGGGIIEIGLFGDLEIPELSRLFLVFDGSKQRQVTEAKKVNGRRLQAVIPGQNNRPMHYFTSLKRQASPQYIMTVAQKWANSINIFLVTIVSLRNVLHLSYSLAWGFTVVKMILVIWSCQYWNYS